MGDAVLRHGGHAVRVEPFDDVQHLGEVRLRERDALGVGHRERLAHGAHETAALLAAALGGAAVGSTVGHARLVDAVVHHELGPHAMANVLLHHMRHAGTLVKVGDIGHNLRVCARRCAKANLAGVAVSERAIEKHHVHALADAQHRVLPAESGGDALLARDAVAQACNARVGAYHGFHRVERLVKTGCLDSENHQVSRDRFACAHATQHARLAVDGDSVARVALITRVVHHVFHSIGAQVLGHDAAVHETHAALADERNLLDTHGRTTFPRLVSFELAG